MQIDVSDIRCYEPGHVYADLLDDLEKDSLIVDVVEYLESGENANIIAEYDIDHSLIKLSKDLERIPTDEEEYKAFTVWLKSLEGIEKVIVTQELYDYFFARTRDIAEGFIDQEDGMFKFYDDDEEYDVPDPDDCYCE